MIYYMLVTCIYTHGAVVEGLSFKLDFEKPHLNPILPCETASSFCPLYIAPVQLAV